ncbi:reticulon-4-interacting protein 1 homolog, mitochondrial-like isoform X2 [Syngnathoides biaculeatus]|uniref:reticulon-4-interacting protein 1 homolog, mitochondrial-like isoform X2 n=1 Tax=Syngnathoides biaculeatus TaxID=300417 RepID=UPI002ADE725A|nr:reticulon-4-interacting protein 1 homolog, mitochondrial-like isoform X2 [Syngnathoides biaculeatus]
MAYTRLFHLFSIRATRSTQKRAAGCARCFRKHVSTSAWRSQSRMSAWVIDQFGTNEVFRYSEDIPVPTITMSSQVMIQVHATSLNPLDVSMRGGYGAKMLKLRRDPFSIMDDHGDFPLILGRDVSGVVVECGSEVEHFVPGDEVWGAVPPWKQGSLAEFVSLTEFELSHKPKCLSHVEAASIPYVAGTALSALVNAGGLCRESSSNKRILIIGGSGGVGTFAIQLVKAWGAHVTVTCSHNAEGLVRGLGADEVVDYAVEDAVQQLEIMERFDVILDNVGGDTEEWAVGLLKPWSGAKYVTLITPLLFKTDSLGVLDGLVYAGAALSTKVIQILPVVEARFPFSQVPQAFQKLELGHARGKTVISVTEEPENEEQNMDHNPTQETATQY